MQDSASILIVDDNRQVLEQINHVLADVGYNISFIPKGQFLFQRLFNHQYDLVLLDVNLPGADGYELLRQMRSNPKYRTLPVIIISAEEEEETLSKCFDLGANDYIRKPIHHEILKARVRSVISASRFHQNEINRRRQEALRARMKMLSSQMNPHFIFNSLSSIQEFVLANEMEKVLNFLSEFAGLMRQNLENSMVPHITLANELQFLKTYLKLEKMRFNNAFTYEVRINVSTPENIMIPPMLIQPYLENAIIHGLRKSSRPGHLILEIVETDNFISCTIQDNGIGRSRASKIKENQYRSVAMSNIEARLALLKMEFGGEEFSVTVKDLWNGDEPAGTLVKLSLPNDLH
ncbi:response regulator [Arenibacter troitsensis]|uniref:Histidine kinase n=1 Tax=Arenibacter troitsensis TaxID=188872 RepID=A0A1X7L2V9_9FLAO|nr:response regulator [Arenibacter troitsensis]SMG48201.1 Histidine kinase [Arenibacter troitsensis]